MSITIAIIGAGAIGERHVGAARETGTQVGYVVDPDLERALPLAAECSARAVEEVTSVFNDPEIDAVVIGVPNWLHRPLALDALAAGKDVLLEKPMGLNLAECHEINAAAERSGRLIQVGLVQRYTEVARTARRLFDEGELGAVYHVKTQIYRRRGVPGLGGWFTTKIKSGGGALIDIGVHLLDLGLHLTGFPRPTEVSGQVYSQFGCRMENYVYDEMWAGPPNFQGVCDVDDAACALIKFDNRMTLELNVTWAGNFSEAVLPESLIAVLGEDAGVSFTLGGDHVLVAREHGGHNIDQRIEVVDSEPFAEQMADFVRAVQDRTVRGATAQQATTVQSLIEAIYQSSEQGSAVRC